MSITIRLAKFGKRNAPTYRIVVANTRDKRNGRFLDILGHFNPDLPAKQAFSMDEKKYQDWRSKGALVTDAVEKLVEGTYEYKKYEPKKSAEKQPKEEVVPAEEKTA